MLRKGIWNVAEDGLGAVHSEHNLIFMPQMRRKYSDSIVTIKVGGTGTPVKAWHCDGSG